MFGDVTVRASTEIIADPRKLLAEIDALFSTKPEWPGDMLAVRNLILRSIQTEYVQMHVDVKTLDGYGNDYMEYVNEKLRESLGARLVRVVGTVVTQTRDEA